MMSDPALEVGSRLATIEATIKAVTLNEHLAAEVENLRRVVDERDRLYSAQFKASEIAVNAALAAQEKAVAAAFLASEKAIVKAEDAQKDYNNRSNEFRGQLDDQAKTLMPRPETFTMFRSTEEKINALSSQVDALRLSKATLEGKADQKSVNTAMMIAIIGLLLGAMGLVMGFIR